LGVAHDRQQVIFHYAQARRIENFFSADQIFDDHTDIVPGLWIESMWRVRRSFAAERDRGKAQVIDACDCKGLVEIYTVMVDSAVPGIQNAKDRKAGGEIFIYTIGAIHLMRTPLAQHQKSGGMVDLTVHKHNGGNPCVPLSFTRLYSGECIKLSAYIWG